MKTVNWMGLDWEIRNGTGGPGPNDWHEDNVSIDDTGKLHLRIKKTMSDMYSTAQIMTKDPLGYGTYRFTLDTPVLFDANVVLAAFTYLDDDNEIDIEYAKWGNPADPDNGQFTVQPYDASPANLLRFSVPPTATGLVHEIIHFPNNVIICTVRDATGKVLEQWEYGGMHFPQEEAKWMFNLWLVKGKPPMDGKEVEAVIKDFSFTPYVGSEISQAVKDLREETESIRKLKRIKEIANDASMTFSGRVREIKAIV